MLLREVEYARPASVQEAVRLLMEHDGARALAGGQTLINVMKARAASPDVLVDLNDLEELKGIDLGTRRCCRGRAAALGRRLWIIGHADTSIVQLPVRWPCGAPDAMPSLDRRVVPVSLLC